MNNEAQDGAANGGPGGDGAAGNYDGCGSGGAGNDGGRGQGYTSWYAPAHGNDGTGGVIILIVGGNLTVGASGAIRANGAQGGGGDYAAEYERDSSYTGQGGGSGGGIVLALHKGTYSNSGTVEAAGGLGGNDPGWDGGAGGSGWVCVEQID